MNTNKIKKISKITKYIQKKYKYELVYFALIKMVFIAIIYSNINMTQKLLRYYVKGLIKLLIVYFGALNFLFRETKHLICYS